MYEWKCKFGIHLHIVFKAIGLNEVTYGEKKKRLKNRLRIGQFDRNKTRRVQCLGRPEKSRF